MLGSQGGSGMVVGSLRIPKKSITTGAPPDNRDENNLSAETGAASGAAY